MNWRAAAEAACRNARCADGLARSIAARQLSAKLYTESMSISALLFSSANLDRSAPATAASKAFPFVVCAGTGCALPAEVAPYFFCQRVGKCDWDRIADHFIAIHNAAVDKLVFVGKRLDPCAFANREAAVLVLLARHKNSFVRANLYHLRRTWVNRRVARASLDCK